MAVILGAVFASGSILDASAVGNNLAKGSVFEEYELWDYTDVISDAAQMDNFKDSADAYLANKRFRSTGIKMTVSTGENNRVKLKKSVNIYSFSDGTSGTGVVFGADEENPWSKGTNISFDFTNSAQAYFYLFTAEIGFWGNAPKVWKLQVSYDNGKNYEDIEGGRVTVKEEGHTEVLFDKVRIPAPLYSLTDYFNAPDMAVYSRMPYRLRLAAVSEENDVWEGSTSGEVCVKKVSFGEWAITLDDPIDTYPVKNFRISEPVLKAKALGKQKARLTWKKTDADGYEIYQKAGNGKFKKIKALKANKTKYVVKKLKKKTYAFKIRAFKGKGRNRVYSDFSKIRKVRMK